MQIAICHENILPARGGAEMYLADLVRRLTAAGHEIWLYASRWDDTALPKEVRFRRIPPPTGPRPLRPWRFSASVAEALAAHKPQVSIGFDKTFGPDVYYPLGGLQPASAEHNLRKYRNPWVRQLAKWAQRLDPAQRSFAALERRWLAGPGRPVLVVNSDFVRRHATRFYGVPFDDIRVIPNAIDSDRFREDDRPRLRCKMRQSWGLEPADVVAAMVSMNYRLKGLEPLLRALPRVPGMKLVVAGSAKTSGYVSMAKRLNVADRVRFIGHCSDVRKVFFAADLLVHPTFYDPCSLVVLEALACGLPVVTTRCNGAGELMHPPAEGFVIDDPHDTAALANSLQLLMSADRRSACGRAARQTAQGWTFDRHARAMLGVLAEAAEKSRRGYVTA